MLPVPELVPDRLDPATGSGSREVGRARLPAVIVAGARREAMHAGVDGVGRPAD